MMKKYFILLIIASFFLLLPEKAWATDYYVSTTGNDSNSGTVNSPWKTWKKAEAVVKPGDTVFFKAGTYDPSYFNTYDGRPNINLNGSTGSYITMQKDPNSTGTVIINRGIGIDGQYGKMIGIEIDGGGRNESIVQLYHSTNIIFQNNVFHNSGTEDCFRDLKTKNTQLIGNEIYDCGATTNQGDAIDCVGCINSLYQNNDISNVRDGIQIKGGAKNIIVEKNIFHDISAPDASIVFGSDGGPDEGNCGENYGSDEFIGETNPILPIEQRSNAKNITIRNNLVYNYTSSWATFVAAGWQDFSIYNNTIANHRPFTTGDNTFEFVIEEAYWGLIGNLDQTVLDYCSLHSNPNDPDYCSNCSSCSSANCKVIRFVSKNGSIKNNIVYTAKGPLVYLHRNSQDGFNSSNNLYYANPTALTPDTPYKYCLIDPETCYSLNGFKSLGYETNSLVGNPLFVNLGSNPPDLKLQSTSIAVDAGLTLTYVINDFNGISRPQGAAYDIGAYEYQTSCSLASSGDFNCDGKINESDLNTLLGKWMTSVNDLTGDNIVNESDLNKLLGSWKTQ